MMFSASRTVSPLSLSVWLSTTWRLAGIRPSVVQQLELGAHGARLGTPMFVTKMASVTCSSTTSVCSPSPGVVSTIDVAEGRAKPLDEQRRALPLRDRVAQLGRRGAGDDEEPVVVVGERGLQDDLVRRGVRDRIDDGALGFEPEGGGDVTELQVGVDEHDGVRRDLGEPRRQVDRDGRLALSALWRDDRDRLGRHAGFERREVPLWRRRRLRELIERRRSRLDRSSVDRRLATRPSRDAGHRRVAAHRAPAGASKSCGDLPSPRSRRASPTAGR